MSPIHILAHPSKELSLFDDGEHASLCLCKILRGSLINTRLSLLTMKTFVSPAALLGLAAVANAKTLTPDNWDAEVAGKTVFIKFQAPW